MKGTKFFECECHGEGLNVQVFEDSVEMQFLTSPSEYFWRERFRGFIKYFKTGSFTQWDIVMTPETARELTEFLTDKLRTK